MWYSHIKNTTNVVFNVNKEGDYGGRMPVLSLKFTATGKQLAK
jgi:hypothetical protein